MASAGGVKIRLNIPCMVEGCPRTADRFYELEMLNFKIPLYLCEDCFEMSEEELRSEFWYVEEEIQ